MLELRNAPLVVAQVLGEQKTVLLKLLDSEEGWYYQAALGPMQGPSSAAIYLHGSSRILDRLRLHGTLSVAAQAASGDTFLGKLSLMNGDAQHDGTMAAALTIVDRCDEIISSPRFLPLT